MLDEKPERFARLAHNVCGVADSGDARADALQGIENMEDFFRSIHMPTNIRELGIDPLTEEQIEELAEKCTYFGQRTVGRFKVLQKEDLKAIYRMAR